MRTIVSFLCMLAGMLLFACTPEKPKAFIDKLMPAPVDGGFAIEDSWILFGYGIDPARPEIF